MKLLVVLSEEAITTSWFNRAFFSINQCFDGAKVAFLSRKVKVLWKIFQIESITFQICAHSKHSHSKKSIIILAFCSLSRTFATDKRVLTMPLQQDFTNWLI
jgi:hypothetical protein